MSAADGFFVSPYSREKALELAKSGDPFERWEAANSLSLLDENSAALVRKALENDDDPLVLSALGLAPIAASARPIRKSLESSDNSFVRAISGPLDPGSKKELIRIAIEHSLEVLNSRFPTRERSVSFPQANSLEALMAMLDQLVTKRAIMGRKLGLSERQVNYYRDALRYLGLVVMPPRSGLYVPDEVLELDTLDSKRELVLRRVFGVKTVAAAFLGLGEEIIETSLRLPRSDEEVHAYFAASEESLGLSGETLTRRAETALAWAAQLRALLA